MLVLHPGPNVVNGNSMYVQGGAEGCRVDGSECEDAQHRILQQESTLPS